MNTSPDIEATLIRALKQRKLYPLFIIRDWLRSHYRLSPKQTRRLLKSMKARQLLNIRHTNGFTFIYIDVEK